MYSLSTQCFCGHCGKAWWEEPESQPEEASQRAAAASGFLKSAKAAVSSLGADLPQREQLLQLLEQGMAYQDGQQLRAKPSEDQMRSISDRVQAKARAKQAKIEELSKKKQDYIKLDEEIKIILDECEKLDAEEIKLQEEKDRIAAEQRAKNLEEGFLDQSLDLRRLLQNTEELPCSANIIQTMERFEVVQSHFKSMLEKAKQQETMAALHKAEAEAAAQSAAQASTAGQDQAAAGPPAAATGSGMDIDGNQSEASPQPQSAGLANLDPVAWNQSPGLATRIAAMEAKDKRPLSNESGKSGKQRRRV